MSILLQLKDDLKKLASPSQAAALSRFFKTGKGQYGEGDVFLGIKVPEQRKIAKKYADLPLKELRKLIASSIHEERMVSLFILSSKYKKADENSKGVIFDFYLENKKHINNWDLIDLSSCTILGDYLYDKDRAILYELVKSDRMWDRRIAVLSTFAFIKENDFEDSLRIAEMLLHDSHDLIHKAVGWMLREIGKRDLHSEETFLRKHYKEMPRTMLRYAIERFEEKKRRFYLAK